MHRAAAERPGREDVGEKRRGRLVPGRGRAVAKRLEPVRRVRFGVRRDAVQDGVQASGAERRRDIRIAGDRRETAPRSGRFHARNRRDDDRDTEGNFGRYTRGEKTSETVTGINWKFCLYFFFFFCFLFLLESTPKRAGVRLIRDTSYLPCAPFVGVSQRSYSNEPHTIRRRRRVVCSSLCFRHPV